jgi:hypothetical protein
MELINAYGDTHGLAVTCSGGEVKLVQWRELSQPDERGSFQPGIETVYMRLDVLIAKHWPARRHASMRDRIITAALDYVAHWGAGSDDIEYVGDDVRPADHFHERLS